MQGQTWTRRATLAGGGATAALLLARPAEARTSLQTLATVFPTGVAATASWPEATAENLKTVVWEPNAAAQPDLWWLDQKGGQLNFQFDYAALTRLMAAASFPSTIESGAVEMLSKRKFIFALRGCTLVAPASGEGGSLNLRVIAPDHDNYRCLIGVADTEDKTLKVFPATTVANRSGLYRQANPAAKLCVANYLPTGRYRYRVGTHGRYRADGLKEKDCETPTGEWTFPLALRLDKAAGGAAQQVVLRPIVADGRVKVNRGSRWNFCAPSDNIHPADTPKRQGQRFSSEGCFCVESVLATQWKTPPVAAEGYLQSKGAWTRFEDAIGLTTEHVGKSVVGVVFTGAEARAAALPDEKGNFSLSVTLRPGSQGEAVLKLQKLLRAYGLLGGWDQFPTDSDPGAQLREFVLGKLEKQVDGDFGPRTTMAWLMLQQAHLAQLPKAGFEYRKPSHVVTGRMLAAVDALAKKNGQLAQARIDVGLQSWRVI